MAYEIKEIKGNKVTIEIDVIDSKEWKSLEASESGNKTIATSHGMQPFVFDGQVVKLGFNILFKDSTAKVTKRSK